MTRTFNQAGDRRSSRWMVCLITLISAAVVSGILWFQAVPVDKQIEPARLAEARAAFLQRDFAQAQQRARYVLAQSPKNVSALLIAAQATAQLGELDEAIELLNRLPDDLNPDVQSGLLLAASLQLKQDRVTEAEQSLRRVLAQDGGHPTATVELARLLATQGRIWESRPLMSVRLQQAQYPLELLLWIVQPEAILNDQTKSVLLRWRNKIPNDLRPLLGLARLALKDNDVATARRLLEQVVAALPELSEAQAQLGAVLLDSFPNDWPQWHDSLPKSAASHPEIWVVRGHRAVREKKLTSGVRCFLEAVRRDPNHRVANYQVGQLLVALERRDLATPFLKRADLLDQLRRNVEQLADNHSQVELMVDAAALTEELGRYWESWGWHQFTLLLQPKLDTAIEGARRVQARITRDLPNTDPQANPALALDVEPFPLPAFETRAVTLAKSNMAPIADIRFEDSASASSLTFQYFNDHDSRQTVMRMMEFIGGGIGVLDYDGDGWPDLHFTQGGRWPRSDAQREHSDMLFRNLGQGTFVDVTSLAGVEEFEYSHGVSVGDFDNDGFSDLFIGNIGRNRLFRNQGDGTFTDVSESSGTAGHDWTTSSAMADFNGDSFPDLYVVNYLSLDVVTKICQDTQGVPRSCKPILLPAAPDQVYINQQDGTFQEQTATLGFEAPEGRGLGIVVANFDNSNRPSVFVANDGEANFLFTPTSAETDSRSHFTEQGVSSGVAFDHNGKPQASMGVAAGDADRDGRLDIFVTNFYHESPTLYVQQQPLLFTDVTRQSGLFDPGFSVLGFGTQFLDADLDGHFDLVVTNGHEGDYRDLGIPFQMPPQFFRNLGDGRFTEISADRLGPFFRGKYLGRGLARVDWNRDGRDDIVISHLDAPIALLTNTSLRTGNYLAVNLRGTNSGRDAIGTRLTATEGTTSVSAQLVAGDGYLSNNHRRITLGMGTVERIERLTVAWPSGLTQQFQNLQANQEIILVEGHDKVTFCPHQSVFEPE